MTCRITNFVWPLAFLLLPLPVVADDAPPAVLSPPAVSNTMSPAPPGTLAQALMEAESPQEDVYLTVAPEKVVLPPDALPPRKGDSVKQVAADYDRLIWYFHAVVAIAPPTMTVLNTAPGTPNPYDGMPTSDALKLLLGSLSDGQWQALTGETGLGDSDLSGDSQHALYQALFPSGALTVQAQQGPGSSGGVSDPITLTSDDLKTARLRLGQKIQIGLPIEGKANSTLIIGGPPSDGKPHYVAYGGTFGSKDTLYGVSIRQTIPNSFKKSDMDFDQEALTQKVPLDGVKTVGDLVLRIGAATKMELYADRRYEKRSVTMLGPKSAPAKDLLRALALCVAGAYRRVGPAFVLTDDLVGVGVRRTNLVRFAEEADIARHSVLAEVGDKLILAHDGVSGLPSLDGGLGFSDTQRALANQPGQFNMPGQGISLNVPLSHLTPQQQDFARRQAQQWNETQQNSSQPDGIGRVTLNGKFNLAAQTTLQLSSPKVPEPVTLEMVDFFQLFQPSSKLQQQLWEEQNKRVQAASVAAAPLPVSPPSPALPPLPSLLGNIPRRAMIARAGTPEEVDALIASMKTIGLNQLWLVVFWGGKSYLDAHTQDGKPDILTEALERTKGTGIVVIPTLDLLKWGPDAPEDAHDLTLMGETSAQAQTRRQRYSSLVYQNATAADVAKLPQPDWLSVCPLAPSVQETLLGITRRLVAVPGVGALALRETITEGYDRPADSVYSSSGDSLGYVPELRLAFLRRDHVDPLDLEPGLSIPGVPMDMSLPEFDDQSALGTADKDWNGLRYGVNRDFLQHLLVSAQQGAGRRIPFLVKQRRIFGPTNWYGLWDNPRAPLPELSEKLASDMAGPNIDSAAFAHTQSRMALYEFNQWNVQSKEGLVSSLQQMKPGWDGIVLDFSTDSSGSLLGALAKSVTPSLPRAKAGKNSEK